MKKAVSYKRVSSESQANNYSIPTQGEGITKYAQEHDLEIIRDFTELGITGTILDRPALNELREFIKTNKVDTIIIFDPDRLSRRFAYQMILTVEFEELGVELAIVKGEIGDTPQQKLLFNMRGVFAEYELGQLIERTQRGRRARIKAGKLCNGKANYLYGYCYIPVTGKREIDPETSRVVQDIFYWFNEENLPIGGVIYKLRDLGVASPSNKRVWARATVWAILNRGAYAGDIFTPSIIEQETLDKARVRLRRNKELAARNTKREYLLRGYIFCKHCGRRYQGGAKCYGGKEYQYYRCSAAHRINAEPCHNPTWKAEELETVVWKEIERALTNPQTVMAGLESIREDNGLIEQELAQANDRLREIDRQQERLLQLALKDFPEAIVTQENEQLNLDRERLNQRKVELEDRLVQARNAEIKIEGVKKACETIRANLGNLSFENKRQTLSTLNIKVWLDEDNIVLEGDVPIAEDAFVFTPSRRNEYNYVPFSREVLTVK